MTQEEKAARARAVAIASRVLAGRQSPLLGSRELCAVRFEVGVAEDDPDFLVFDLIESETDTLPIGPERQHWADSALADQAEKIAEAERWAMSHREAFESLLLRFGESA